jgi:hypothetical protein
MGNQQHANLCLLNVVPTSPIHVVHYAAFGVGSIRGLALIEAWKCILERSDVHVDLKGVSGSSVGSIMCLAILLQLTPDEMVTAFSHNALSKVSQTIKIVRSCGRPSFMNFDFLKEELIDLMRAKNMSPKITFAELNLDVRIAAHDIKNDTSFIFSRFATPDALLIDAIVASCAIPYVFAPVQVENVCYSDGGQNVEMPFLEFPSETTIGLYLYDRYRPRRHANSFFSQLDTRQKNHIISIDVSRVSFLDLNPTMKIRDYLKSKARQAVNRYYDNPKPITS